VKRLVMFLILLLVLAGMVSAETDGTDISTISRGLDTIWVLLGAFLVFFMQAGFGMIEAGFIRAKNTTNVLAKNFLDFIMASLAFFIIGYALMFGKGGGLIGFSGFFMKNAENPSGVPLYAYWLFQAAFAGAAASIVAGAVAERMKFAAYLAFSFLISAFIYPVIGHWAWGGGWLMQMGFTDFAGSAVVHITGGIASIVGTIMLKPRTGKYRSDGTPNIMGSHNIPLAALGAFILWFGWFGFNGGSTLSVGNGELIARVVMNTNLAAAAGGLSAMITVWIVIGKPDVSMIMNGALAGLVAVTASCAFIEPWAALLIGAAGGVFVVYGVIILDKLKIDDPVGAFPVHGINGIWGAIAVGLFGRKTLGLASDGLFYGGGFKQLGIQLTGIISIIIFAGIGMYVVFTLINKTIGLRVSREDELRGLDISQHGMEAYEGFQIIE